MPLSEHEQRLLEQMERALASEDPKFASTLRGTMRKGIANSNLGVAILAVVFGVAGLIVAVTANIAAVGIAGFVAIVTGLSMIVTRSSQQGEVHGANLNNVKRQHPGFFQGLEDRWDRRQDGQ